MGAVRWSVGLAPSPRCSGPAKGRPPSGDARVAWRRLGVVVGARAIRQRRAVGPLAAGVAWRRLGVVGDATRCGRPVATSQLVDDDDDVLASALERAESELEELESDEESLDDDESFESDDEPLEDDEADSFSLRRPLALAPWSFL